MDPLKLAGSLQETYKMDTQTDSQTLYNSYGLLTELKTDHQVSEVLLNAAPLQAISSSPTCRGVSKNVQP